MERNENGPLNLYKRTILCTKLLETIEELKSQGQITPNLEKKIMTKFDEIICDEIGKVTKNKNTIKGNVTSFKHCDDIWIFYCTNILLNIDKMKLSFPKLKVIALDENLKTKNKIIENRFKQNGEG